MSAQKTPLKQAAQKRRCSSLNVGRHRKLPFYATHGHGSHRLQYQIRRSFSFTERPDTPYLEHRQLRLKKPLRSHGVSKLEHHSIFIWGINQSFFWNQFYHHRGYMAFSFIMFCFSKQRSINRYDLEKTFAVRYISEMWI